ncbi:hypothetical protein GF420_11370 [candidate division GN15 bacterium]|nr:hypothetical protein [candidate division GN15 bacterium]
MNAAHAHLILNHLPVIGLLFGIGFLLVGLLRKHDTLIRSAFTIFIIVSIATIPVFLSGEAAEDVVENLPGVEEAYIHAHEEAGETALIAMIVLGLISIAGLWVFRFMNRIRMTAAGLVLVLSLVVAGWMAYTANLGGEIRHPEIREDFIEPVPSPGGADVNQARD